MTDQVPSIDDQYKEAARWASLLIKADYPAELHGTGQAAPFHREWQIFDGPTGPRIATIDVDGCGASWHGPDDLWYRVIGPHSDLPEFVK